MAGSGSSYYIHYSEGENAGGKLPGEAHLSIFCLSGQGRLEPVFDERILQSLLQRIGAQLHQGTLRLSGQPWIGNEGLAPRDLAFLQEARRVVLQHLDNEQFGVRQLAQAMQMGRTRLFRRIKAITGRPAVSFINQVRIAEARYLLAATDLTVSEIAFRTGFSDPSYLRRVFLRETGITLTEYRRRLKSS